MQQTNQYKFNLIESGDQFSPAPLNENAEKTEQALKMLVQAVEKAKESGLQALSGNYVGNGTSGSGNPNTLTFPFKPLVVIIANPESAASGGTWLQGITSGRTLTGETTAIATLSWNGNSLSWYHYNSAAKQLNEDGKTYLYLALGMNKPI